MKINKDKRRAIRFCMPCTCFPRFEGDFLGIFIYEIAKKLKENGYEIDIICPHNNNLQKSEVKNGLNINRFQYMPFPSMQRLAYGQGMAANLKKSCLLYFQLPFFFVSLAMECIKEYKKCDVIHAHFAPAGLAAVIARKFFKTKKAVITSFYGSDILSCKRFKKIYRPLLQGGDLFLVLSKGMKTEIEKIGCDPDKVAVFNLGIDMAQFDYSKHYSDRGIVEILFVGRIIEKKGLIWGIKSFSECYKKNKNIRMTILGNGPALPSVMDEISRLGISPAVRFIDNMKFPNPRQVTMDAFKKADIFMLPSITTDTGDKEGTPVVLMEAQAAGLPCVSTLHAGIPEIVLHGKTGFLSEEKDYKRMAMSILKLVEDRKLLKHMGRAAKKYARGHFDINKQIKKLEGLYNRAYISKKIKEDKLK